MMIIITSDLIMKGNTENHKPINDPSYLDLHGVIDAILTVASCVLWFFVIYSSYFILFISVVISKDIVDGITLTGNHKAIAALFDYSLGLFKASMCLYVIELVKGAITYAFNSTQQKPPKDSVERDSASKLSVAAENKQKLRRLTERTDFFAQKIKRARSVNSILTLTDQAREQVAANAIVLKASKAKMQKVELQAANDRLIALLESVESKLISHFNDTQ